MVDIFYYKFWGINYYVGLHNLSSDSAWWFAPQTGEMFLLTLAYVFWKSLPKMLLIFYLFVPKKYQRGDCWKYRLA